MPTAINPLLLDRFNDTIDVWRYALNTYELDDLLKKQDINVWSLGQIYMHILNDTHWYLQQLKKTFNHTEHSEKEMNSYAKEIFKVESFPPIRIQGDQDAAKKVPQPSNTALLKYQMDDLKRCANEIYQELQKQTVTGKSLHPGFGYFCGYEWFAFAEMHMRHHMRQKENTEHFLVSISK